MGPLYVPGEGSPGDDHQFTLLALVAEGPREVLAFHMAHHLWLGPPSKLVAYEAKVSVLTHLLLCIPIKVLK